LVSAAETGAMAKPNTYGAVLQPGQPVPDHVRSAGVQSYMTRSSVGVTFTLRKVLAGLLALREMSATVSASGSSGAVADTPLSVMLVR
jgi:hypothetical protein